MNYKTQKNRLRLSAEEHKTIKALCFHSARLYNVGLYSVRQFYFSNNKYLSYAKNYHECKVNKNYSLLLTDIGQQVLKLVDRDMKSFFSLLRVKKQGKYSSEVRLPRYKKQDSLMSFSVQGRSVRIKNNKVYLGITKELRELYQIDIRDLVFDLPSNIKVNKLQELRIQPRFCGKEFDIEFVYKSDIEKPILNSSSILSLDFGLDNFVTAFNSTTGTSFILDGKYIKSLNQWYNKQRAYLQSIYDRQEVKNTRRMNNIDDKRNNQINDYLNRCVRYIVNYCIDNKIGKVVWGDFEGIKQEINLGKRNNQNFVGIPYYKFKQKLSSLCEHYSITTDSFDESYTSKCSFLDNESIEKHESYLGSRIKRGLFKAANGKTVNADVNGSANILRKFASKQNIVLNYYELCRGLVNSPVRLRLTNLLACISSNSKSSVQSS